MSDRAETARDLPARALELGLALLLLLAPMPFGAVGPRGRLALELFALLLLLLWLGRALGRATPAPPRAVVCGIAGMLVLALAQALPLGDRPVAWISPRSAEIRTESIPPAVAAAEERLLGTPPGALDRRATISLDAGATASALRTGCALAALLVVATAVAALRGVRTLAFALLISAGFQGLYGLLAVASGHDRIWHLPKKYFLDNATGTFVNRNHFACLMAMSLACGAALILADAARPRAAGARRLAGIGNADGGRSLVLVVLLIVGLAGLLLSFSRAGIAIGLLALVWTLLTAGGFRRRWTGVAAALLVVSAALLPLAQIGGERLLTRYRLADQDFIAGGGRVTVWRDTLAIAADFPLAGCGYGSFSAIYPLYRSPEVRKFYAHAHNDLIQALAEGGVLGLACLALLLLPVLVALARAMAGSRGPLAVGFAAGLAAVLLHSLFDFNLHIPSNAATAAVLAGAVLGLPRAGQC